MADRVDASMADDDKHARSLRRDTCFDLLRTVGVGRVAWATDAGEAVVLPVNFVVDEDAIVFRTAEGGKLDAVREGRPISFEADDVEPALHVGWSVLMIGQAEVVVAAEEVGRLDQLPLAPWERTPKQVFVRLRADTMTGRRLPLHPGGVTFLRQGGSG
jgi:nitroimidazol reductase NimA-like FMN-containing flavoprotein (pyridoxamine 5'-phosphate oxidase superfamily)